MASLREWIRRLWGTLRAQRDDRDLEQELQLHMELAAEDAVRSGSSPEQARAAARTHAGGVAQAMEALRDQRGLPWLNDGGRDVRYAVRQLRRTPAFSAVAIVTLALGIGGVTAIFSAFDRILIRPLPYTDADRLVMVWDALSRERIFAKSFPAPAEWPSGGGRNTVFTDIAATQPADATLSATRSPNRSRRVRRRQTCGAYWASTR